MAGIQLTGLASGLDWQTLIQQMADAERTPQTNLKTQQTTINNENNAYGTLKTELGVLQNNLTTLKDPTLYDSRTSSVSDTSVASSTVASGASIGTYAFDITQLATAAQRTGTSNIAGPLTSSNPLTTAGFSTDITAGTFTVNGSQVTIATSDTLDAVFAKISAATSGAVTGKVSNDKIVLTSTDSTKEIILGSATDSSNFLQVAKLYNNGTGSVTSTNALGGVLLNAALQNSNLSLPVINGTSGTNGMGEFKVNGVSITYDSAVDSMNDVLTRINNSTAGVTASYDSINDRFQLTSKATGDINIALQNVSGNFLTATGLAASTLTHGNNLLYTLNGGDQLVSQSNTITDASSGVTGLSLSVAIKGQANVTVASDNATISSAINGFISQYNRVQSLITTDTASTTDSSGVVTAGILASDGDATDLGESLRSQVFTQLSGLTGSINHLADLGIQTNGTDNTLTLSDSTALDSALSNNLSSVKDFFTNSTSGLAVTLNSFVDRTIGDSGTVTQKQTDLAKQSTDIDTQVANMEKLVQDDIAHWTTEFTAMESAQQAFNQQSAYLTKQFP